MTVVRVLLLLMFAVIAQAAQAITGEKAEFKKVADDVYAFVGKLNDRLFRTSPPRGQAAGSASPSRWSKSCSGR